MSSLSLSTTDPGASVDGRLRFLHGEPLSTSFWVTWVATLTMDFPGGGLLLVVLATYGVESFYLRRE